MVNEKRLIDANALMDAFRSHMVEKYDRNKCTLEENCKTCESGCLWRKKVSDAPTVDAVEVVRCKDCKHWKHIAHVGCSDFAKVCMLANYMIGANGYCLYGERKDND